MNPNFQTRLRPALAHLPDWQLLVNEMASRTESQR